MTPPGSVPSYTAAAGAGVVLWGVSLETYMGLIVGALTIAVLVVRLWVDISRLRKRKEP